MFTAPLLLPDRRLDNVLNRADQQPHGQRRQQRRSHLQRLQSTSDFRPGTRLAPRKKLLPGLVAAAILGYRGSDAAQVASILTRRLQPTASPAQQSLELALEAGVDVFTPAAALAGGRRTGPAATSSSPSGQPATDAANSVEDTLPPPAAAAAADAFSSSSALSSALSSAQQPPANPSKANYGLQRAQTDTPEVLFSEQKNSARNSTTAQANIHAPANSQKSRRLTSQGVEPVAEVGVEASVQRGWSHQDYCSVISGTIFLLLGLVCQFVNEERSARADSLVVLGRDQLMRGAMHRSAAGNHHDYAPKDEDDGRLVHVCGDAIPETPITDPLLDLQISGLIRLQRTMEVCQQRQGRRPLSQAHLARGGTRTLAGSSSLGLEHPRLNATDIEWSVRHVEPRRSRGLSPQPGVRFAHLLGTETFLAQRVSLEGFVLPEDMLGTLGVYDSVMQWLPERLYWGDTIFYANYEDGCYYARPKESVRTERDINSVLANHRPGDLRIRYLGVPQIKATVVAVQWPLAGVGTTFVPYQPEALGPCLQDSSRTLTLATGKARRVKRSAEDCCGQGFLGCLCCACNAIVCIARREVASDEIYVATAGFASVDQVFQKLPGRKPERVWLLRLLGLLLLFCSVRLLLAPFAGRLGGIASLAPYRSSSEIVVDLATAFALSMAVAGVAHGCYRPWVGLRFCLAAILIAAAPALLGSFVK